MIYSINDSLTGIDFNLYYHRETAKIRPLTARPSKVKHFVLNGGGRDHYIYDNHGGQTKGNDNYKLSAYQKFTGGLRSATTRENVKMHVLGVLTYSRVQNLKIVI